MKVLVTAKVSNDMRQQMLEIIIDNVTKFSVHSDEQYPEDNRLSDNFEDCYDIPALLRKAWEAGKNGEDFKVEYVREEDF
ncbi:hypothetical protein PQE71_gp178 [Bacillus phage Izhevsk]|uniref:Uncharacterized protein n=2 Tax=Tsamsavirus TaxID=3044849 RepID=A0A6H0X6A7_9CAUD|nr:hypothetical protein X915_gp199 [Bacillus phage vB_BanS-Tsamsa]YP_010680583.1 hypothetical protein PQE71_gp178 [Bacillus phage Izhevsk]AGI11910.1 hypothetical protein [Bacillus phage vB_BanS-Tsamsa]QIW89860.1 hypothetical protein Izhevsk_179 [Bacillus phage Izhevsk]UUV46732.1 hypothetical protein [Bacillus phage vB_BanS-Thrax4]